MKRFVSNSLFGGLSSLSATLGNLLSGLAIARLLGVEGSGSVAFAIWAATTLVTVFGLGIPATLARFLPSFDGGSEGILGRIATRRMMVVYFASISVPVIALSVVQLTVSASTPAPRPGPTLYVFIAALCLTFAIGEFVRGCYRGHQDFSGLAKLTALSACCQFVGVLTGAALFGLPGALTAYVLGAAVVAFAIRRVPSARRLSLSPDLDARLTRYACFRWASDINAAFVWSRIEVFFLQIAVGTTQVGLFTAGLTLVNLAIQGVQMLGWGLLPHFTEQFSRNAMDEMRSGFATVVRLMALLTFPACLGLAAILPELVPLLFGARFSDAVPSAMILLVGATAIGPGTVAVTVMWATERSDIDFLCGLSGAVVALLGGIILIPHYGSIGAAISRVLTQLVFVGFCNVSLVRAFGFRFPIGDLARLMLAALACACVARLSLTYVWRGAAGLPLSICAAAVTYGLMVRVLGSVPYEDLSRLARITDMLPSPIGLVSRRALRLIAHAEAV